MEKAKERGNGRENESGMAIGRERGREKGKGTRRRGK